MSKMNLLDFFDWAQMAYSNTPTIEDYNIIMNYNNSETGVQFFVGENQGRVFISFRGSDERTDWNNNLKFWRKTLPYGNQKTKIRIHTGFYNLYQTIREEIQKIGNYCSSKEDIKSINIVGHSLGGALAVLSAIDLQYNFPQLCYNIVVFGCPRVGNNAFATSYNNRLIKTIRVENGNDLVSKLPLKIMGYKHVGAKVHIGFPRFLLFWSIKSHYRVKYYEKLWRKK